MAAFIPGNASGVYRAYVRAPVTLRRYVVATYTETGRGAARVHSARAQLRRVLGDIRVIEDVLDALRSQRRETRVRRDVLMIEADMDYAREVLRLLNIMRVGLARFVASQRSDAASLIQAHVRSRARDRAPPRTLYGRGATHDDGMADTVEFGSTR
jgi:hypothetical protein